MILCFDIGGSRIKAGRAGADGAVTNSAACQQSVAEQGILVRAVGRFAGAAELSGFHLPVPSSCPASK
ncbi:MAG: hypothetical protein INF93_14570 [Rhodobacter sp.]|jgi:hypothetical protein|nr:hypothetical protein [Rhodobacter sp.]